MKKIIAVVAVAVMLLCGCAAEEKLAVPVYYGQTAYTVEPESFEEQTAEISVLHNDESHTYKGVLLKDVLASLEINTEKVLQLSVKESGGDAVIYTNSEINDEDKLYLVFECDGSPITVTKDEKETPACSIIAADELFSTNTAEKIEDITVY